MKTIAILGYSNSTNQQRHKAIIHALKDDSYQVFQPTQYTYNFVRNRLDCTEKITSKNLVLLNARKQNVEGILKSKRDYYALRISTPEKLSIHYKDENLVIFCDDKTTPDDLIKADVFHQIDEIYILSPLNHENASTITSALDKQLLRDRTLCIAFASWCIAEGFTTQARPEDFAMFLERYLYRYR